MQTIAPDAPAPVVIDFRAVRAARASAQTPPQGTGATARILMACFALVCLAFASMTLRAPAGGALAAAQPRHLRVYCANGGWGLPLSHRNCFVLPAN